MNQELNLELEKARQGAARLRKIDSMLQQLKIEEVDIGRHRCELEKIVAKENEDVSKLEHTSLASLFHSVLGKLDEQMAKEQKEALAARLKYDQVAKDLADVQARIAELCAERAHYLHCPQEFEELYSQKKGELLQENGESARHILELADAENRARINLQEISQAIAAGQEALDSLERVEHSLDSAGGWGTLDLLGGGLLTDLVKHSHIDEAQIETENTQRLLRRFKTELADIQIGVDIVIETGGFAKFADFFLDGLIADWFMQSRIRQSQDSVCGVRSEVEDILRRLVKLKNEENSLIEKLAARIKEQVIEG